MDKNILKAQKKGMSNVNTTISFLVGALIVVVMAVELAPEMFGGVADLDPVYNDSVNSSGECIANCSTPEWVPAVLYVVIGAGIVFLIWRAFGNK